MTEWKLSFTIFHQKGCLCDTSLWYVTQWTKTGLHQYPGPDRPTFMSYNDHNSIVKSGSWQLGTTIFIDREAREIMHWVASVHPSVCPFVCALTAEFILHNLSIFRPHTIIFTNDHISQNLLQRVITSLRCFFLCICNQWAYADNRAYAVDRRFNSLSIPLQLMTR